MSRRFRKTLFLSGAATIVLIGCKATPPGRTETAVANWTKHHVTIGGKRLNNPVVTTPQAIADGRQAFTSYCMVCHGLDGQNTGVPFAASISPSVPSLASAEVQAYTDGQIFWIIKNGIYPSGMPPSTGEYSDEDMWQMVLYIRHLPPKGSLGEPAVYTSGGAEAK